MNFTSLARAEKEAGRLLERFQVTSAPVDVESIATHLGLEVRYERFRQDLSGVLVKQGAKNFIGINATQSRTRQRFSIAHEIGHFWLGHPGDMFIDEAKGQSNVVFRDDRSAEGTDAQEMEANRFAAAVLMPAPLLLQSMRTVTEAGIKLGSKEASAILANQYEVSAQAMNIRLTSLGLIVST